MAVCLETIDSRSLPGWVDDLLYTVSPFTQGEYNSHCRQIIRMGGYFAPLKIGRLNLKELNFPPILWQQTRCYVQTAC